MAAATGYYGRVGFRIDLRDCAVTRVRHDAGRRLPRHGHARAFFSFVERGGYADRFGRHEFICPAGAALFHPPDIVHRDEIAPGGASFLVVEVGDALFRRACEERPIAGSRHDLRDGELARAARRLARECRDPARSSALVVEGLVLEMLGIVARPARGSDADPPWLACAIDRLRADLDRRVTIEELARVCGVPPVRLARTFRRRMGVSVGEYARGLRVRWVEERLSGGAPLAQLAVDAGFVDQSHMTRVFRRLTGRTPGSVRRSDAAGD